MEAGGRYSGWSLKPGVIARNGRQNPHILIWLGPGRRTGRRRGSVTCTETSPIQSQWRFRSDCLLPSEIGYFLMWTYFAFDSFCFVLASIFRKKKKKERAKYRPLWQLNFFPGSSRTCRSPLTSNQIFVLQENCPAKSPIFLRTSRWNPVPFDRLRWKTCLAFDYKKLSLKAHQKTTDAC